MHLSTPNSDHFLLSIDLYHVKKKKRLENWIAHLQELQLWVTTVLVLKQIICDVIAMLQVAYPPIKGHLDPHTSLLVENIFASFQRDWCQRDGGLECHPKKGPTIHGIVDQFLHGSRLDMMYRETEHMCTRVVELRLSLNNRFGCLCHLLWHPKQKDAPSHWPKEQY